MLHKIKKKIPIVPSQLKFHKFQSLELEKTEAQKRARDSKKKQKKSKIFFSYKVISKESQKFYLNAWKSK